MWGKDEKCCLSAVAAAVDHAFLPQSQQRSGRNCSLLLNSNAQEKQASGSLWRPAEGGLDRSGPSLVSEAGVRKLPRFSSAQRSGKTGRISNENCEVAWVVS